MGMKTTDDDQRSVPKIEIESHLYEKLRVKARELGYSSPQEFILRVLEESVAGDDPNQTGSAEEAEQAVRKRLQGLGYLE